MLTIQIHQSKRCAQTVSYRDLKGRKRIRKCKRRHISHSHYCTQHYIMHQWHSTIDCDAHDYSHEEEKHMLEPQPFDQALGIFKDVINQRVFGRSAKAIDEIRVNNVNDVYSLMSYMEVPLEIYAKKYILTKRRELASIVLSQSQGVKGKTHIAEQISNDILTMDHEIAEVDALERTIKNKLLHQWIYNVQPSLTKC